ncbi:glycosyltransferase family 87 protein [Stackebrandtia nassauensis]|nr:glycosyltransferase 87 family protein [Stackebrandtia nassauensis]
MTRPTPGPEAPSRTDPVVASLSRLIGGPLGRQAIDPPRRRFWIPPRVILLSGILMFALAWLQKLPCADGNWQDFEQYTRLCYTDIRALWGAERLNEGAVPYFDHPVEYPVLTGILMGAAGLLAHAGLGDGGGTLYYHLNAIVLLVFGMGTIAAVYGLRRERRPWDAMLVVGAPALLFTGLVNWDLLAVGLTVFFLLAWARRRPVLAGVLLGLAVAAKFYPLLLAGPMLVLAFRNRRLGPALSCVGIAAGTWLAVNLPFILFAREGWLRFFQLNSERGIDWGTLWYVLRDFAGPESAIGTTLNNVDFLNYAYLVLFALSCVAIAVLTLKAPEPPRFAQLSFLVIAAFLITGKVWSQQYLLWLLPLAVLARPRWRTFLLWQAAELFYFVAFYGELLAASNSDDSPVPAWALIAPEWVFVAASITRLGTVIALCALVVRETLNPRLDVVRASYGGLDPDSGLLAPPINPKTPLGLTA